MNSPATLLFVDDDPDDRELFLLTMSKLSLGDVKCEMAVDGADALKKLSAGEVSPDIIFLDLNMPLMNGHQVLEKLKADENTRDIPVVILSTASDAHTIAQSRQAGAACFFTKPVKVADWGTMLRSALSIVV